MKRHIVLIIILLILGLFVAFSAASHSYDSALIFIEYETDDGRPIVTDIPEKCFSKGVLICAKLHPVFKGPGTIENPGSRSDALLQIKASEG